MLFLRRKESIVSRFAKKVGIFVACLLFGVTVLQGVTLCLCAPDPDGCGEQCHDCGSVPEPASGHVEHLCDHLKVFELPPAKMSASAPDDMLAVVLAGWLVLPPYGERSAAPVAVFPGWALRPPSVLYPQLRFIARSIQVLC